MIDDTAIKLVLERVRQNRAAIARTIGPSSATAPTAVADGAAVAQQGTRVFDTVSGLEGEVIHGTRQNLVVSTPERGDG